MDQGLFQETLYFRMVLPPGADSLSVDTGQTDLKVRFEPVVYNALGNSSEELRATAASSGAASMVMVEFPRPVHLTGVKLRADMGAGPAFTIEIFRVDGDAVSQEPSATACYHAPASPGTVTKEAASKKESVSPTVSRAYSGSAAKISYSMSAADVAAAWGDHQYSIASMRYRCSIKGSSFALKLTGPGGDAVSGFGADWLSGLIVTSLPSSPSVSLTAPGHDDNEGAPVPGAGTTSLLVVQPGELGGDETLNPGTIPLAEPFSGALQDALSRLGNCDGANAQEALFLDFALIVKSGTPCAAVISDFSIESRCVKKCLLETGMEKKSLKFSGKPGEAECVNVTIPQIDSVKQASLKVDMSLDRNSSSAVDIHSVPEFTHALESSEGLEGEAGAVLLQPLEFEDACLLHAINLPFTVLEDNTILSVCLISDSSPSGDTLVIRKDCSLNVGTAQWTRLSSEEPLLLNSGACLISVEIHQGRLIWHTTMESGGLIRRVSPQGISHEFRDRTGLYFLEQTETFAADSGSAGPGGVLRVDMDGMELPVIEPAPDQPESVNCYDMRNAVTMASGENHMEMTVRFSTSRRGMITVYAPDMVYESAGEE